MSDYSARRVMMVDTQVRPSDVTKFPIIEAMLAVPREAFVPADRREAARTNLALCLPELDGLDDIPHLASQHSLELGQQQAGIKAVPTPYSPWGLRIAGKPALNKNEAFVRGDFEVQDEDLYEKFERNWTFYEMIEDYYREYPDPNIRILKEKDYEGNEDKDCIDSAMDVSLPGGSKYLTVVSDNKYHYTAKNLPFYHQTNLGYFF